VKVGNLVKLSVRGKNKSFTIDQLPEILDSYGIIVEIGKGKNWRPEVYYVEWCTPAALAGWCRYHSYQRYELKYAK